MQGYQLIFYTQQDRMHGDALLGEWIVEEAKRLGIRGATLLTATQGFGHDGRFHAAGFFDLSYHPVLVLMAVTAEEADALLQSLDERDVRVFYTKVPAEFGMVGRGSVE